MLTLFDNKTLFPRFMWWFTLAVILVFAGAVRYTGYNFSLPYIDHVDEASYNLAARMIIDFGSPKPLGMHGYPPGIIAINYVLLNLFHDPAQPPGSILWMVRLLSVTFSMGTLVVLALCGYRLINPLAGLLAAAVWAWSPIIVEHSRFATADNFVTFFTLAAFFLMFTGVQFQREGWQYGALIAALLAIVFKYQAIFILPVLLALPLWRAWAEPAARRRVFILYVRFALILGVFLFWLVMLFPALEATNAPDWSAPTERLGLPTLPNIIGNFGTIVTLLSTTPAWWLGWAGLLLVLWPRTRAFANLPGVLTAFAGAVFWVIGISFYGAFGLQQFRQFISAGAFLAVLAGGGLSLLAALALTLYAGPAAAQRPEERRTRNAAAGAALAAGAAALVLSLGDVRGSLANAYEHTLPDHRNMLTRWMDTSLPPGALVVTTENHKTFNRDWGGYAGVSSFPTAALIRLDEAAPDPIADWRATGARYAVMPGAWYDEVRADPARDAVFSQTLLVRAFPYSEAFRGPDMVVLQLTPIRHPIDAPALGPVRVLGYDLLDAAGEALEPTDGYSAAEGWHGLRLYWGLNAMVPGDYAVFNHLVDADGALVAQSDGDPLADAAQRRPTSRWGDDLTEVYISRVFPFTGTADLPPGEYTLMTGFYARENGARLQTDTGETAIPVFSFTVAEAASAQATSAEPASAGPGAG